MPAPSVIAPPPRLRSTRRAVVGAISSMLHPRTWFHVLRIVHFYGYTHAAERSKLSMGAAARIAPTVSLSNADQISVGPRTNIGSRCTLWAAQGMPITIGSDCLIAPGVMIVASGYEFKAGSPVVKQRKVGAPVVIGDDCWVGANVVVFGGVTIESGAVIGANSVVTKSVAAGSIVAGSPAREVGQRFATGSSS